MIKNFYTLLFCLLMTVQAIAQQTISGSIQAADSTPLIGATVVAQNSNGCLLYTSPSPRD